MRMGESKVRMRELAEEPSKESKYAKALEEFTSSKVVRVEIEMTGVTALTLYNGLKRHIIARGLDIKIGIWKGRVFMVKERVEALEARK